MLITQILWVNGIGSVASPVTLMAITDDGRVLGYRGPLLDAAGKAVTIAWAEWPQSYALLVSAA